MMSLGIHVQPSLTLPTQVVELIEIESYRKFWRLPVLGTGFRETTFEVPIQCPNTRRYMVAYTEDDSSHRGCWLHRWTEGRPVAQSGPRVELCSLLPVALTGLWPAHWIS
jgi:hypothetical protein